jgi:hypothetical protein
VDLEEEKDEEEEEEEVDGVVRDWSGASVGLVSLLTQ